MTEITYFDRFGREENNNAFLSNFYEGEPLHLFEREYATGEHLFQAFKTLNPQHHEYVRTATSPGVAKRRGRSIKLRPDWESVKYDVMRLTLFTKFTLAREEGQLLLSTGDALLIEGTDWNDQVWGVARDLSQPRKMWPGRNWLGTLLMARRAELRAQIFTAAREVRMTEVQRFVVSENRHA